MKRKGFFNIYLYVLLSYSLSSIYILSYIIKIILLFLFYSNTTIYIIKDTIELFINNGRC